MRGRYASEKNFRNVQTTSIGHSSTAVAAFEKKKQESTHPATEK